MCVCDCFISVLNRVCVCVRTLGISFFCSSELRTELSYGTRRCVFLCLYLCNPASVCVRARVYVRLDRSENRLHRDVGLLLHQE